MISWALKRASLDAHDLTSRFPELPDWEAGRKRPTLKQLKSFAKAAHVPFGYMFLSEPPAELAPIPDFRALGSEIQCLSPNLRETVYTMQYRSAWLREDRIECEAYPLDFVGSARLNHNPEAIGREMRQVVGEGNDWNSDASNWIEAVSKLRNAIEQTGVMVIINSVVGNNNHRKLRVEEFRGFSLCDEYAPLIFVNGSDAKSAQMFTLAHELAHIWLGSAGEGLSRFECICPGGNAVEDFCDKAAAEFLLPAKVLKEHWMHVKHEPYPFKLLSQRFKVSPIVAGRRAMDLHLVDQEFFFSFYNKYTSNNFESSATSGSGGDFYSTQNFRVGRLFADNVIRAAMEGRVSFREAYYLTGLKGGTFQKYAVKLGFKL